MGKKWAVNDRDDYMDGLSNAYFCLGTNFRYQISHSRT